MNGISHVTFRYGDDVYYRVGSCRYGTLQMSENLIGFIGRSLRYRKRVSFEHHVFSDDV